MMVKFLSALLSIAAVSATGSAASSLDERLAAYCDEHRIPAMAIAVVEKGEVVHAAGFGMQKDGRTAVSQKTRFRIASLTKLFTAQAIMQLETEGKVSLSDPVAKHLPRFRHSEVTIKQLLTHSAGLQEKVHPLPFAEHRPFDEYLAKVLETNAILGPMNEFAYSDTGYNLLGEIISRVSARSYEAYIHHYLLQAAGMEQSGFYFGPDGPQADVEPYRAGLKIPREKQWPFDPAFSPSGGLIANAADLSRWITLVLSQSPAMLNADTYNRMLEPQRETPWFQANIALGWFTRGPVADPTIFHLGGIRGYESVLVAYPTKKRAVIVLTNSSDVDRWEIVRLVEESVFAKP